VVNLPSHIHTGRELELMLAGRKPLAMFYAFVHELPNEEFIPEEKFAPYVLEGRCIRVEEHYDETHPQTGQPLTIRYVFFAEKGEEWRIPAMKLVKATYSRMRKTEEGIERIEGSLLGYTNEENDAWCEHLFKNRRFNSSLDMVKHARPST
jgi:hypothetical protein